MKKPMLTIIALAILLSTSAATLPAWAADNNAPTIKWQRTLVGGDGYSVYQLSDGSFILSAANQSATFLIKLDSSGNLVWMQTIENGTVPTVLPYLVPTSDGGYALAGIMGNMYVLAKTDSQGKLLWIKLYSSGAPINYFRSIIQTSDGGFAIAGFGEKVEDGEGWIWFAKTDASGNLLWDETLSGPMADCPSTIIQLTNGYVLSDVSYSIVPNQAYFRLIRTDLNGNVLWNQTYGDQGAYRIPECNCAIKTTDDGYLMGGFLSGRNAWVVKTDANGNMQWNQTYGTQNSAITCIHTTKDGGYIMSAVANFTQAWILKTDAVGNQIWNVAFPGATLAVALEANFNSVIQTKDGGYVVMGTRNGSAWIVELANPQLAEPELIELGIIAAVAILTTLVAAAFYKRRNKILKSLQKTKSKKSL